MAYAVSNPLFSLRRTRVRIGLYVGGGGIRTHDTFSRIHAFQACSIGHLDTPPERLEQFNEKLDN